MKASRYNRIFQSSDGTWLAFNSWSTALAELEPESLDFVRSMLKDPDQTPCDSVEKEQIREALLSGHFLIDDEMDELATLKSDLFRDRFRTDMLDLTIAPTLDCNFRCDYCYEEHLKVTMSQTVQDALVRFVEERAPQIGQLNVCWYGGEPLLPRAWKVTESLSERFLELCAKHKLRYTGQLVTNGFFLDKPKMERLVELQCGKVQVTLDGTPDLHDKRRVLIGGRGTFWHIIENLKQVVDLGQISLRMNVDQRNAMTAIELMELLRKEGLADKVAAYLGQVVFDGAACGNIVETCYSREGFATMEQEVYAEAAKRDLPLGIYPSRLPGAYCTADRLEGYVVAPTGSLFKCWHEVTLSPEKAIGSLLDDQLPHQKANEDRWLAWNAFENTGCRSCDVLPMCHGGCPLEAMENPESDRGSCDRYKFHLEPILDLKHKYRLPVLEENGGRPASRDVSC